MALISRDVIARLERLEQRQAQRQARQRATAQAQADVARSRRQHDPESLRQVLRRLLNAAAPGMQLLDALAALGAPPTTDATPAHTEPTPTQQRAIERTVPA